MPTHKTCWLSFVGTCVCVCVQDRKRCLWGKFVKDFETGKFLKCFRIRGVLLMEHSCCLAHRSAFILSYRVCAFQRLWAILQLCKLWRTDGGACRSRSQTCRGILSWRMCYWFYQWERPVFASTTSFFSVLLLAFGGVWTLKSPLNWFLHLTGFLIN